MPHQREVVAWNNFTSLDQDVEKLIYPLSEGDEYDCGYGNEVYSQMNVFQGALEWFNDIVNGEYMDLKYLNLPSPQK